jgi:hypothetical protein
MPLSQVDESRYRFAISLKCSEFVPEGENQIFITWSSSKYSTWVMLSVFHYNQQYKLRPYAVTESAAKFSGTPDVGKPGILFTFLHSSAS